MLPKARKKNIVIQPLDDEILIYDLRTDRAHCLNRTASLVWRYCDGKTDIPGMSRKLAAATGEPANQVVVQLALQRLHKAKLLDAAPDSATVQLNRREVIRKLGRAAAITIPLVTSIIAPEAAQAASCIANNAACTGRASWNGKCCCNKSKCVSTPGGGCKGPSCTY